MKIRNRIISLLCATLENYYSGFEGFISGENKTKLKQYWVANATLTALIVVLSQRWLKLKKMSTNWSPSMKQSAQQAFNISQRLQGLIYSK